MIVSRIQVADVAHGAYRKWCQSIHVKPMPWDSMSEKMQECWIEVVYSVIELVGQAAKDRGLIKE